MNVSSSNLVAVPESTITEKDLHVNVQYIASCLCENGAAPINDLMENAAIVEISRTQG